MWQMYSSDYDTQASFYGVKKANAPLHVQMDLSDYTVAAVNTTLEQRKNLHITARIVSPANVTLDTEDATVSSDANSVTPVLHLPVSSLTQSNPLVFVRLEMRDEKGTLVADNFYWTARDNQGYRGLNDLAPTSIEAQAMAGPSAPSNCGEENTWNVRLKNTGATPAVAMKLTLFHADNTRVLPAYYSDNYISLLPGEERTIAVHVPSGHGAVGNLHFTLRGWNLPERDISSAVNRNAAVRAAE
jgi:hypothetical protein